MSQFLMTGMEHNSFTATVRTRRHWLTVWRRKNPPEYATGGNYMLTLLEPGQDAAREPRVVVPFVPVGSGRPGESNVSWLAASSPVDFCLELESSWLL